MDNPENVTHIKKILERNNYQVTTLATDNGCLVVYPERVEHPPCPAIRVQYEYTPHGLHTTVLDEEGKVHRDRLYPCPPYGQRLMMFAHIISRCLQINYAVALIGFMVNDAEVEEEIFYEACMNKHLSTEEATLEDELKPLIVQCMFTVFTPLHEEAAKETGVLSGFLAIRNMLTGQTITKTEESDGSKEENPMAG